MKRIKENYIYILILLFPIFDILTSFSERFLNLPISISVLARGLLMVFAVITSLWYGFKNNKKVLIYDSIIIIFCGLFLLTRIVQYGFTNAILETIYLCKFWYLPIMLIFMCIAKLDRKKFLFYSAISILLYDLGIVIPLITNTAFSSYQYGNSGIVGWFYSANEIGALLSLGYIILFLNLENSKKYGFALFVIIMNIICLSLLGTKVATLSLIVTSIFVAVVQLKKEKFKLKNKNVRIAIVCMILSLIFSYFSSNSLNALQRIPFSDFFKIELNLSKKNNSSTTQKTDKKPVKKTPAKVEKKEETAIGILLSGRQRYLVNTNKEYTKTNLVNKIFGMGFFDENNEAKKVVELDFFDIFYSYGLLGFIIYFLPIIYFVFKSFVFSVKNKISTCTYIYSFWAIFLGFGVSFVAGHSLGAPLVSFYLAYFLYNVVNETGVIKCLK